MISAVRPPARQRVPGTRICPECTVSKGTWLHKQRNPLIDIHVHMNVNICMWYVHIYMYVYTRMYLCMHAYFYTLTDMEMHACMY